MPSEHFIMASLQLHKWKPGKKPRQLSPDATQGPECVQCTRVEGCCAPWPAGRLQGINAFVSADKERNSNASQQVKPQEECQRRANQVEWHVREDARGITQGRTGCRAQLSSLAGVAEQES